MITESDETFEETQCDIALLRRVLQNDQDAWTLLVQKYAPLICCWINKSRIPADDQPDVLQEVFQSVVRGLTHVRNEPRRHKLGGWIRTITRNRIIDYIRRSKRFPRAVGGNQANEFLKNVQQGPVKSTTLSNAGPTTSKLSQQALWVMKRSFKPQVCQAFVRTAVDGLTATEVATELGTTAIAVRKNKSRVLHRLKDELARDSWGNR